MLEIDGIVGARVHDWRGMGKKQIKLEAAQEGKKTELVKQNQKRTKAAQKGRKQKLTRALCGRKTFETREIEDGGRKEKTCESISRQGNSPGFARKSKYVLWMKKRKTS